MFSTSFWKQAFERCVKSAAQGLLGMWALDGFNTLDADYKLAFGVATGAAVLSLLTSVVTAKMGEPNSPSAVELETVPAGPVREPDAGPPPAL